MLVIRAGVHKILVRIANREDPDPGLEETVNLVSETFFCKPKPNLFAKCLIRIANREDQDIA